MCVSRRSGKTWRAQSIWLTLVAMTGLEHKRLDKATLSRQLRQTIGLNSHDAEGLSRHIATEIFDIGLLGKMTYNY
jgi:hypothetical protein